MSVEDEREALDKIIEALDGFDEDVQRRILETVAIFYQIKPKQVMRDG